MTDIRKTGKIYVVLVLLATLLTNLIGFMSPVQASPEPLRWTKVRIPTEGEAGKWVLAEGSDIDHLALAGDGTLYAGVSGTTYSLYRSTDGGLTWTSIGNVTDTIIDLAISPLDDNKIYYATTSAIYRSVNAGRSFEALPPGPGGAGTDQIEITSLDVAGLEASIVTVATADTDSGQYGGVYFLKEEDIVPSWVDANIGSYDVYGVAFSPRYKSDRQLIAVITDEVNTYITGKIGDNGWGTTIGNARLNRDNTVPPTPVAVASPAVVVFPDNYSAESASGCGTFFVAINTGTGEGDVYQICNAETPAVSEATDLNTGLKYGLNNIDVNGLMTAGDYPDNILMAGEAGSTLTYSSTDAGAEWERCLKQPSGEAVTCMLAAFDYADTGRVYAATGGDGSALSLSRDTGATWNQISLIDTAVNTIIDMAPSPRYTEDNTLFILTFGAGHSLWRSRNGGNNWERILNGNPGAGTSLKLIGLPPQYNSDYGTVFIAGKKDGNPAVWQSTDNGQSYRCRLTRDPVTGAGFSIDTWAIIDETSLFIGSYDGSHGMVYKTTNGGFIYSEGITAGDQQLNSLVISPFFHEDGIILAGNTDGWIYHSTDNGSSYRPLPGDATSPPFSGLVTVAFDTRFDENGIVYAAGAGADEGIRRFRIPTSQEWSCIDTTLSDEAEITSIVVTGNDTMYAVNSRVDGGMERCLSPGATSSPEFETLNGSLPDGTVLFGLWQSGNHVWSVDTVDTLLLTFYDTSTVPIFPVAPGDGALGIGYPGDNSVRNIILDWETQEGVTGYQWQCDYTSEFGAVPDSLEGSTSASSVRLPALEPATTYHWRVRACSPVLSPWSEKRSFTTSLDTVVMTLQPEHPTAGASGIPVKPTFQWTAILGASCYEVIVATDADFNHPAVLRTEEYALPTNAWQCDVSLDHETTYYWKVRAVSVSTYSPWSSTGVFTTESKPMETAVPPVLPILSPLQPSLTEPVSPSPTASLPAASTPLQIQPAPTSSPPQGISAIPAFSQPLNLPAWVVYLILGLLATVVLALVVILAIILKIRRL